jgi:hypothetical protein
MCAKRLEKVDLFPDINETNPRLLNYPFRIPEQKIGEECITAIAKQKGINENIVRSIHDFQWAMIKEGTDTFRTIFASKFFKLKLSEHKVNGFIKKIDTEIKELEDRYENVIGSDARKKLHDKIIERQNIIKTLREQLAKCMQKDKKSKNKNK